MSEVLMIPLTNNGMCEEGSCSKLSVSGCISYSPEGVALRIKRGYCPIGDLGPNKKVRAVESKQRVGQQKQKRK